MKQSKHAATSQADADLPPLPQKENFGKTLIFQTKFKIYPWRKQTYRTFLFYLFFVIILF